MPMYRSQVSRPKRRGFTLLEMLVVVALLITLLTITVAIGPRLADEQRTSRAADVFQGWLLIAKQRAYRDGAARGIRLVRDADNPNLVRSAVFIEVPEDFRDLGVDNGSGGKNYSFRLRVNPAPNNQVAFILNTTVNLAGQQTILPGDYLRLDTAPYSLHRINQVQFRPGQGGTRLVLASATGQPSRVSLDNGQPLNTTDYRIIRAPRPMVGEANLQMPKDVAIDLDPSTYGSSFLPPYTNVPAPGGVAGREIDIIFGPKGQLVGDTAASTGKLVLRIRNVDHSPDGQTTIGSNSYNVYQRGDQTLLTIYTRTGLIAAHPVNHSDLSNLSSAYDFVRDGKSSGL